MQLKSLCAMTVTLLLAGSASAATITQVSESAFTPQAGLITFSEYAVNTVNPVYTPAKYGGGATAPTVTFGGFFTGQSAGSSNPSACPTGAAVSGCVLGSPTGPLSIASNSPNTFITTDGSTPTSPVLTGSPQYNGSIAIFFSTPQAGVGLTGGYFNAIGSTAITAFGVDGSYLGQVKNSQIGIEFLGLVTSDGSSQIGGLLFSLVGNEPAGFVIDNVRFGQAGQVTIPGAVTPEPSSLILLVTGIGGMVPFARARFRQRASSL